jgi:phosphate uptake regulator
MDVNMLNHHKTEEIRKIQFTGSSSYIVSLPKKWIQELGIKPGDSVIVSRPDSNILEILPNSKRISKEHKEASVDVQKDSSPYHLARKLISLYFLGYNTINISPKPGERLTVEQRGAIKEIVRSQLMGTEITADSAHGMTLQVLVNLLDLSIDTAFKRMTLITKSMHQDAMLSLQEHNKDLAREIIKTDDEVDRFSFYIIRQLVIAIKNGHRLKEIGLDDSSTCLVYRLIVKSVERIADHATKIVKNVMEMDKPLEKDLVDKISQMSNFALGVLDDACLSLFKKEYNSADKTIEKAKEIVDMEKDIIQYASNNSNIDGIYRIKLIAENIRRVSEYATDIAEGVLNITVEKTMRKE